MGRVWSTIEPIGGRGAAGAPLLTDVWLEANERHPATNARPVARSVPKASRRLGWFAILRFLGDVDGRTRHVGDVQKFAKVSYHQIE